MNIIQTYQQGGRHKINNEPCEDRTYSLSKNGVNVIALADGAGNSKYTHSADGAECVTKTISNFFCDNFDKFYEKDNDKELSVVVKTVCQRVLQKKAEKLGVDDISRFASTLLCVAIKDDNVICCHIGDGVIGKLTPRGAEVVSAPENGEFASTTFFITSPNAERYIHVFKDNLDDTISYFLMSDGTSDYIYNKYENSFYDAAKKMALMAFDLDGQTKLENTVSDYMVNKDSKSDDCSFICLTVKTTNQIGLVSPNDATNGKSAVTKSLVSVAECTSLTIRNTTCENDMKIKYDDILTKIKRKNKRLVFILAIFIIITTLLLSMLSRYNDSENNEKTTVPTVAITTQKSTTQTRILTTDRVTTERESTVTSSETTTVFSSNKAEKDY